MLNVGFTGSRAKYWENTSRLLPSPLDRIDRLIGQILMRHRGPDDDPHIHVGDADGVDGLVVLNCRPAQYRPFPLTIYGLNGAWRNINKPYDMYLRANTHVSLDQTDFPDWKQGYAIRDKKMVDNVDKLYAIWDGTSPGTKLTFEYAIKQGKQVHIAQLVNNKWVWS